MTDNPPPPLDVVAANIRAELARSNVTVSQARSWLDLGETAWSTRMSSPSQWRLQELIRLAELTGCRLADLARGA